MRLTTEEHLSRDGLSKRLRETLSLLLEGHSEKQVASELGLGNRTVHDYVTMLYQHFRVSSARSYWRISFGGRRLRGTVG